METESALKQVSLTLPESNGSAWRRSWRNESIDLGLCKSTIYQALLLRSCLTLLQGSDQSGRLLETFSVVILCSTSSVLSNFGEQCKWLRLGMVTHQHHVAAGWTVQLCVLSEVCILV